VQEPATSVVGTDMHVKKHWKALVVGGTVAATLALVSGWALAEVGPGHASATTELLTTALRSSAVAGAAGKPASMPAALPQATGKASTGTQQPTGATAPHVAGLLLLGPQGALDKSLGGDPATGATRSVTGGGTTSFFTFGFTDQSHFNGAVAGTFTGNAEITFPAPNRGDVHIRLNCLQIVGNDAFVSGVSTNVIFSIPAGTEFLFGVRDDDSAPKPDLFSDIFFAPFTPPATCMTFHAPPHYAVQGNIEIH
jgi:hypothetical protein